MGKVAITFKVMPKTVDTDVVKLKDEISKKIEIQDYHVEEIAFGLKVLRILVLRDDAGTDELEKEIKSFDDVSEVEVESTTLV